MRAFVTGATGFIGRRLVERSIRDGHDVTALVRSNAGTLPIRTRIANGALEDSIASLAGAMRGHDLVYHLAARISFDTRDLGDLLRTNSHGTRKVLQAARAAGVPRVVVVSSACTIGITDRPDRFLDESAVCDPALANNNPYMRSKWAAEAHAIDAARSGQHVTIVNPTTVFGPGDDSLNSGTLVRQVARALVMPVPPGGSNVIDVDDVVSGIIAAGQRGRSGARYILGGENLRFREIIEKIAAVVGRRPVLAPLPPLAKVPMQAAAAMIQRIIGGRLITPQIVADTFAFKFFSSRRAESELGWRARKEFTSTLATAWEYYQREGLIPRPAGIVA